ncbi:MAG: diacylglycerol kinase family protein [Myxococcota bacterium]
MSEAPRVRDAAEAAARLFVEKPGASIVMSFRAAFAGIARCVASQRNMKLHLLSGQMVMIVGMALPLDLSTRVALLFAVAVVFFAEILNTGLEALVDLYIGEFHRLAMLAKDAAAAGVLVLAVATVLILGEILWQRWDLVTDNVDAVLHSVLYGVPFVGIEALGLFVLRRGPLALLRIAVSGGLLLPLLVRSEDPIYGAVSVLLVIVAAISRHSFPGRMGRGAPPRKATT